VKFVDYPVLVVVWEQHDCPACDQYGPVFREIAARYQNCVPSVVVLADHYPQAADHYFVQGTPPTMMLRYGRRTFLSIDGPGTPEQIHHFFAAAMQYASCQL